MRLDDFGEGCEDCSRAGDGFGCSGGLGEDCGGVQEDFCGRGGGSGEELGLSDCCFRRSVAHVEKIIVRLLYGWWAMFGLEVSLLDLKAG